MRQTARGTIENIAESIHWVLHISYSDAGRDTLLRHLLENQDRIAELSSHYRERHRIALLDDIKAELPEADALRAYDYMTYRRLRSVSKVLLALDGLGTSHEVLWRSLTDAHGEGAADRAWSELMAAPLPICERWRGHGNLDGALAADLSGGDLDRGKALWRYGQLRPIDKIRVATNCVGTDIAMLMDGLRAADAANVRQTYRHYYDEDLEDLLFDRYDDEGNLLSSGELSGGDADRARALLGGTSTNVDALANIVRGAVSGMNDVQLILNSVRDAQAKVAQGGAARETAERQLDRLRERIADSSDPLGIRSMGGLSSGEHAQLIAMLGMAETRDDVAGAQPGLELAVLNDDLVRRLRALGGVDDSTLEDGLRKGRPDDLAAWRPAWRSPTSPFYRYVQANSAAREQGRLSTILTGTVHARLELCNGGLGDDKEEYAYDLVEFHASEAERLELRQTMRAVDRGEPAPSTPAGRAITALHQAFSDAELNTVRAKLRMARLGVVEEAEAFEEDVERERSWWYGQTDDLQDARREVRAGVTTAGLDARLSPSEEASIRASLERGQAALQTYRETRDTWTGYASTVVGIASGLLVTALTGGAAGPAVMAAILRAAVASAAARVLTEKALNGERFNLAGDEAARAFALGAVDGVMNVLSAGAASGVLSRVVRTDVARALAVGEAGTGLRLVQSAVDGTLSGGVSGVADAVTNEATWQRGVTDGLASTINAGLRSAGQGAVFSTGMAGGTAAWHGATEAWAARQARRAAAGEAVELGPDGRPLPVDAEGVRAAGQPGARRDDGPAGAAPPAGATPAGAGFFDAHPVVSMARAGNDTACVQLLQGFGRWEVAHAHLEAGTGPAARLSPEARTELRQRLTAHRNKLIEVLRGRGAEPLPGASTEGGSDADLNIRGDDAGQRLIDIRTYLDGVNPEWRTVYRMDLMVDAGRIGSLREVLAGTPEAAQQNAALLAAAQQRLSVESETLLMARRLRHLEPAERTAQLERITNSEVRARVAELASLTPDQVRQRHDRALQDGDALQSALRAATDLSERARIAEQLTSRQMLANALGDEAYVSPGGVHGYALGNRLTTPGERYQAVLDQMDMIHHQVAEHGGLYQAIRRYEVFKYIQRTCDALEQAGVHDPAVTAYRHLAELYYRMDRAAMGVEAHAPGDTTGLTDRHRGGISADGQTTSSASRTVAYNEADPSRPGVDGLWLLQQYEGFRELVQRNLPDLRRAAGTDGSGLPLTELPAVTARDRTLATSPETGLATDRSMARTAEEIDRALLSSPVTASHSDRIRAAAQPVLQALEAQGITAPTLEPYADPDVTALGDYDSRRHVLRINTNARTQSGELWFDTTTPVGQQRLANTLYHEARHCEQAVLAMRYADYAAGGTLAPSQMQRQYRVAPEIAMAAQHAPFTAGSAGGAEFALARRIFEERFGTGPSARRTRLAQDLVRRAADFEVEKRRITAELMALPRGAPERRQLMLDLLAANDGLGLATAVYRNLVEEIDAYAVGERLQDYLAARQRGRDELDRAVLAVRRANDQLEAMRAGMPGDQVRLMERLAAMLQVLAEQIARALGRTPQDPTTLRAPGQGGEPE